MASAPSLAYNFASDLDLAMTASFLSLALKAIISPPLPLHTYFPLMLFLVSRPTFALTISLNQTLPYLPAPIFLSKVLGGGSIEKNNYNVLKGKEITTPPVMSTTKSTTPWCLILFLQKWCSPLCLPPPPPSPWTLLPMSTHRGGRDKTDAHIRPQTTTMNNKFNDKQRQWEKRRWINWKTTFSPRSPLQVRV